MFGKKHIEEIHICTVTTFVELFYYMCKNTFMLRRFTLLTRLLKQKKELIFLITIMILYTTFHFFKIGEVTGSRDEITDLSIIKCYVYTKDFFGCMGDI